MGKNEDSDLIDPSGGYQPTRPARLRPPSGEPPPLPPPPTFLDDGGFGEADEDGLRMLAALEELTSLEPDYSDDVAAEASVTIIESAGYGLEAHGLAAEAYGLAEARPLRALLDQAASEPALLLNGYETFLAPGDEASVEIVEVGYDLEPAEAIEAPIGPHFRQPASLAERIAAATGRSGRFFKALSGH